MNVIEYEDVKIFGDFEGFAFCECNVEAERNSHATAEIVLLLKEGIILKDIQMNSENKKILLYDSKNNVTLFAGKVRRIEACVNGSDQRLIVWADSYSVEIDDIKKSRSFQNVGMTYQELAEQVVDNEAMIFCTKECSKAINRIYIQYQETNWAFLKRIAAELGLSLFVDITKESPVIYIGSREIEEETEFDYYEYSHGFSASYFIAKEAGYDKADFIYYDVESYENYEIGAKVLHKDESLWICKKTFKLDKGQICFTYRIGKRGLLYTKKYINMNLSGAAICGKVLETKNELLKIHLEIDPNQDKETAFSFKWTPLSGNLMYCMPQIGTKVNLYFADGDESSAKVVNCVGGEKEDISSGNGSSYRAFTSEHGKRMELSPDSIRFATGGEEDAEKNEVVLKDSFGLLFASEHKISICARGEIKIEGQSVTASGLTAIQLLQTGVPVSEEAIQNPKADIEISGNEDYFGENVYVEAHGERMECAPFDDAPEEGEFDWGGLLKNIAVGLVVAVAVAGAIALTAATFGAAAPMAVFVAGCIGGAVAVGCLAYSDYASGNVSETGRYAIKGFTGALSGSLAVLCGPTATSGHFWAYVSGCAVTGAWTSAVGNGTEQALEKYFYGDNFSVGELFCSTMTGGLFGGLAGALSYGLANLKYLKYKNMSRNEMQQFLNGNKIKTKNIKDFIEGISGQSFDSRGAAVRWAKDHAQDVIMAIGKKDYLRILAQMAGVETSTSGILSNASSEQILDMLKNGTLFAGDESSLDLAQLYIAQYGY